MKVSVRMLLQGAIFLSLKTTTEQMHLNDDFIQAAGTLSAAQWCATIQLSMQQ